MAVNEADLKLIRDDLASLAKDVGFEYSEKEISAESWSGKLIDKLFDTGILRVLAREGRASDVDEDGITDSGQAFFSADMFETRDIIRQTVFDHYQLVRIIRNMGTDINANGKIDLVEGDFNFDGISDIGGFQHQIYFVGMSMGSLVGSVILGTEPLISTGVLNVGGGTLTDLLMKTKSKFNVKRVFHQLWGTAITGIHKKKKTHLIINGTREKNAFKKVRSFAHGSYVFLRNLTKKLVRRASVNARKGFLVTIPADRDDLLALDVFDPNKKHIFQEQIHITHQRGVGYMRNTPEFLRLIFMGQWIIDPAEPINFARYFKDKNVLLQVALGDWTVPTLTGMNLARAAGLISPKRFQWLLSKNIHRGAILEVDTEEFPPEQTSGSSVRFHPSGKHEYLVIPNVDSPEEMAYTKISQKQVIRYLLTNGRQID